MKLKLRRRSVYIGTIAAILALVGGLAVAGVVLTFTGTTGFNTGSQTVGNTIYSATPIAGTFSLQSAAPGACGAGPAYTPPTGDGTDVVYVSETGAICTGNGAGGELYDELVFSASGLTALHTYIDTISITTTPASPGGTITVAFTTVPTGTTESLTIWVDLGAADGNAVTNVNIGIAGN